MTAPAITTPAPEFNVKVTVEDISPKEADLFLRENKFNRPYYRAHMISLARQMTQGIWLFTGMPIIVNDQGQLLNGQHTLGAIIHSGTTQTMLVVRGVPSEGFEAMDTGKKRSYKDALHIAGIPQQNLYGALANKMMRWERMIFFGGEKATTLAPSNKEIVDYCKENTKTMAETINFYVQMQEVMRREKIITGGVFIFAHHLFKNKNKAQAQDFMERLLTGHDVNKVPKYQPIDKIRKRLIQNKADDAKLSARLVTLMLIGAWNAYRKNKKLHTLHGLSDIDKSAGKKIQIF